MNVTLVGTDPERMAEALKAEGHAVTVADVGNRPGLEEAGIHDADVYLLTEMTQATSIVVAKDLNPDLRVVVYAEGSLPDFASRQADLVVDPNLLGPDAVAEELQPCSRASLPGFRVARSLAPGTARRGPVRPPRTRRLDERADGCSPGPRGCSH